MEILSFDMINYLPKEVICGKNFKKYPLIFNKNENHLFLFYLASISKGKYQAKRKYSYIINRHIKINSETFEVVGLLQAEMGKTQNGCLNFANHEFKIINKVMNWFEKELELRCLVETANHMIKSKYSHKLKTRTDTSQINEILMKCLCHNLAVLTSENFKNGLEIDLSFCAEDYPVEIHG